MNNIIARQNQPDQINRLAAQRYLYSKAKNFFLARLFLSLVFAIIAPILMLEFKNTQYYIAISAVFYLFVDFFFLRRVENSDRKNAAKIQESFDLELFELPWNDIVAGNKIEEEKVLSSSKKYKKKVKNNLANLYDWYSKEIGDIDLLPAVAICQRTNVYWDVSLREKLFWSIMAIILLLSFVLFFWGKNSIVFLFSVLPFYEVIIDYAASQYSSVGRIKELKNKIEELLEKLPEFKNINSGIKGSLRAIQDQLFRHRESCSFVPDWFYKIFRDRQEEEMNYCAKHYVDKFLSKV
ncbi:MAG: S-4TM family putative pore-forming effector [Patescibacteria group bacterium]|nr:S-4TM family putative pore-forming effector [Patescibacteria group bacterium]